MPVGPNLGLSRDGIRFLDPIQAARNPASWIGAFQAAIDAGTEVTEEALSCIQQHVDRLPRGRLLPGQRRHVRRCLRLLKPRAGLYARLSEMHDCGLLGRVFPEFQAISWRVVRDFYHKYTVDEHTLLTIRNLERLSHTDGAVSAALPERRRSNSPSPSCWSSRCCCTTSASGATTTTRIESVRMARDVLDRLQLTGEARETVLFLIKHHLRMSLVAFRRDTEDPEIVKDFAAFVGTEERLKMLCLLTLADVEAVSPETLTPWKEELLWRLYVDTYNHLTQRYGDERIERNQAGLDELLRSRPEDLSAAEITRFLEGLPQRYLQLLPARRHLPARPAGARHPARRSAPVARARRCGLDAGRRHARQAVPVLEHLRRAVVVRHEHHPRPRADQPERTGPRHLPVHRRRAVPRAEHRRPGSRCCTCCEDVVAGRADVAGAAARPRARRAAVGSGRRALRRWCAPTTKRPAATPFSTSSRPMRSGCSTASAASSPSTAATSTWCSIATEGEKAIDVFHITKGGSKLTEAEQQALTSDLHRILEGTQ